MTQQFWWERDDLAYRNGRLHLADCDLTELAAQAGTPTYVYSMARVKENIGRLRAALAAHNVRHKLFYAIKANRYLPLVTHLQMSGLCGIDACSPNELLLARQVGFAQEGISYTATSVSDADLDVLQRHPKVHVNCDALSVIRRLGERCPGRSIGIRINPQVGAGYTDELHYAGDKATKFGIYQDRFVEAVDLAKQYNLQIKQLHFHFGSGYRTEGLPQLAEVCERAGWFLAQCSEIDTVDIGGGLGVPVVEGEQPVDLELWAATVAQFAQAHDVTIHTELGDFLMKDAGVLLLQVNSIEEKGGTIFVGVNGGFNLQNLSAYYKTPFIATPLQWDEDGPLEKVTVAGNINEVIDLLAEDVVLPRLAEGDMLALLNVGGYGSSSSSNHCMRGQFVEYLLP